MATLYVGLLYRAKAENDLYFINQFIYKDLGNGLFVPDEANATIANDEHFAFERSLGCWRETGRIPNFVYVDMYQEGNVLGAVQCLNRLPRETPPAAAACDDMNSDAGTDAGTGTGTGTGMGTGAGTGTGTGAP